MLLYAYYTPYEVNINKREKVFAFASIESCVHAMKAYNRKRDSLDLVTRDRLLAGGITTATRIRWNPVTKVCEEAGVIWIEGNAMHDTWDGKQVEINLVEHAADEKTVTDVRYP